MSWQARHRFSVEEYLQQERDAEVRSEYLNGEIHAMTGASPAHNLIVTNVVRELGTQLKRRPCRVYANDQRVRVETTGLYTYPDVVVTCGAERFDADDRHSLLNPLVIVEVLSESTERYDRGAKFGHYRRLDSLAEYLLISQDQPRLEHYRHQPDGHWLFWEVSGLDGVLELPILDCRLALAEVYDKVEPAGAGAEASAGSPRGPGVGE